MYEYVEKRKNLSLSEKAPIQRKVGFEFQSMGKKVLYEKQTEGRNFIDVTKPGNGVELFKIGNIKVTADGHDIEYVTPAYDETTPDNVTQAITDCGAAATYHYKKDKTDGPTNRLRLRIMETTGTVSNPKLVGQEGEYIEVGNGLKKYYLLKNRLPNVHPQATIGIVFSKLPELIDKLTQTKQKVRNKSRRLENDGVFDPLSFGSSRPLTKMHEGSRIFDEEGKNMQFEHLREVNNIFKQLSGEGSSPSGTGLSTLSPPAIALAHILAQMSYMTGLADTYDGNPKSLFPIMPRTSPRDIFNLLSNEEKTYFENAIRLENPPDTVSEKLRSYLARHGNILVSGPENVADADDDTRTSYSDWLGRTLGNQNPEFTGNVHTLAEISMYNLQNKPYISRKYGGIRSSTDIVGSTGVQGSDEDALQGLIVELRALPRFLSKKEQWEALVETILNTVKALNQSERSSTQNGDSGDVTAVGTAE